MVRSFIYLFVVNKKLIIFICVYVIYIIHIYNTTVYFKLILAVMTQISPRKLAYIEKYGYFSHNLIVMIEDDVAHDEKMIIFSKIYDLINNVDIVKNVSNRNVCIKWKVENCSNLDYYYTNCDEICDQQTLIGHTRMLLNDILKVAGDKITILVSPLNERTLYVI